MAEHTLYEDCPARVEIEYKYNQTDELEIVDEDIIDYEDVAVPVLYCECGAEFENFDSARSHLQENS